MRRRLPLSLITGLLVVLALPSVVLGHAAVLTSTPADGSTVSTAIASVSVTFDEEIGSGSHLEVLDASGAQVGSGSVTPSDPRTMSAPFVNRNGSYEIRWTAVSTDGDIARGVLHYTVALAPTASLGPGATGPAGTLPPASPASEASQAAAPAATPLPAATSPATDASVAIPIAFVVVLLGAGFVLLTRRARAR